MKKQVLSFFLFISFFYSFGQIASQDDGRVRSGSNFGFIQGNHLPDSFLKSRRRTLKYEDIEGTPYINNKQELKHDIPIGTLYSSDFKFMITLFLRYNAYTDNMELSLIDDGIDYQLLKKKPDAWYIVLGKNKYRAYEYYSDDKNVVGFFVIISENDRDHYSLFKKEKIIFQNEIIKKDGFLPSTPDQFKRAKDSYFLRYGEKMMKISRNKKDFFKLFHTKQNILKEYIKTNKYKITNEKDLLVIITYYNSLIK